MYSQYETKDGDGHPDNWSFPASYQRFSAINRPRSLLGRRRTTESASGNADKSTVNNERKDKVHNKWAQRVTPRGTPLSGSWHTNNSLTHPVSNVTPSHTPISSKEGSTKSQAKQSNSLTSRACRRNLDYATPFGKIAEERPVLQEIGNKTNAVSQFEAKLQELPPEKENSDTESSLSKNLSNKELNNSFIADDTGALPLNNSTCQNMSQAFLGQPNDTFKDSSFADPANNSSFMTAHGIHDFGTTLSHRSVLDGLGVKTPGSTLSLFCQSDSPIDPLAGIIVHDDDSHNNSQSNQNRVNETLYTTVNETISASNKRVVEYQKPSLVTNIDIPRMKPSDMFLKPQPPVLPVIKKDTPFVTPSLLANKEGKSELPKRVQDKPASAFPTQLSSNQLTDRKHGLEHENPVIAANRPKKTLLEEEQSANNSAGEQTTREASIQETSYNSGNSILDRGIMNNTTDVSLTNSKSPLSDSAEASKQPLESKRPNLQSLHTKPIDEMKNIVNRPSLSSHSTEKQESIVPNNSQLPPPSLSKPQEPVFKEPQPPPVNSREKKEIQTNCMNQESDFLNPQFHMPRPIVKAQPQHYIYVNNKPYNALSLLGRGGSSEVYQVIEPSSSKLMAIKCVNLASVEDSIANGYLNEIQLLQKLQGCPSVIKMFDHEFIKNSKMVYVVMEKGDIDLSKLIRDITKTKEISMSMIVYYWTEMLNAVKDIHDKGIIHSDLKPANFLLVGGRLKLIDFGIASSLQGDMTSVLKDVTTGTFNYMSPEAITCSGDSTRTYKINYRSDVWSLGCILYNLLYGRTPYSHITNTWVKLQAIADRSPNVNFPKEPVGTPMAIRLALRWCLLKDPKQRPTTAQLLQLPYHSPPPDTPLGSQVDNLMLDYIMKMFPECPIDLKTN